MTKRARNHDAFSISQGTKTWPFCSLRMLKISPHMQVLLNSMVNSSAMAASMGFSNVTMRQNTWSKPVAEHSLHAVSGNRTCQVQEPEIRTLPQLIYMKRVIKRKEVKVFAIPSDDSGIKISPHSPASTIMQFYMAINEKNLKKLDKLIAEDCFFDDFSFPKPFQGKKEALHFLKQLTSCMGQNTQFNIEHLCEGNDFTVGVNWHLDWNKIQVPFTRGCSYYSLSTAGDKLVITKAQVLIESPIKPGGVALTIFKIVTSLFDAFPAATEWFLKSPHVIFQMLLKTYNRAIQPIISPFIEWYIKLLHFAACILSFTLKLLYYLANIFHM